MVEVTFIKDNTAYTVEAESVTFWSPIQNITDTNILWFTNPNTVLPIMTQVFGHSIFNIKDTDNENLYGIDDIKLFNIK